MAAALYDPDHGYYAAGPGRVGRAGDFFTSVSAGPLFGRLLARHARNLWRELDRPHRWRLLELGADAGHLAEDLLDELERLAPEATAGLEYAILEPLPALAAAQRRRLGERVRIVPDPDGLAPLPGLVFGNEVIDALPCERVECDGERWWRLGVGIDDAGRFEWRRLGPADCAAGLPPRPAGYRTELRPCLGDFLAPLVGSLERGRMLWIDYGFGRDDYLDPARRDGTLRTFAEHRAGDDALVEPGGRDLSAHVDFDALREALEGLGGRVLRFETQAAFLTGLARDWLLELEGATDPATAKLLRNFQTLTHPGHLGTRFHALEAAW